jgi:DNA mismatch endonuclease (patch repair protein)
MDDPLSPRERSARMALVKGKHTGPELMVRSIVHGLGFRYRLHAKELPGSPDLVFRRRHKVIFVHGCFWHRHGAVGCILARLPKSRPEFWIDKLEGNRKRDVANVRKLREDGWKVLQLWECELKDKARVQRRILRFLP